MTTKCAKTPRNRVTVMLTSVRRLALTHDGHVQANCMAPYLGLEASKEKNTDRVLLQIHPHHLVILFYNPQLPTHIHFISRSMLCNAHHRVQMNRQFSLDIDKRCITRHAGGCASTRYTHARQSCETYPFAWSCGPPSILGLLTVPFKALGTRL